MNFPAKVRSHLRNVILAGVLAGVAGLLFSQSATPPQATTPAAPPKKVASKSTGPVTSVLTNQDIIKLVKAKISDDLIIQKISTSKTRFDTSVDGLVALRDAGVDDRLLAVMMNPGTAGGGGTAPAGTKAPAATNPPPASAAPPGPEPTRPLPPKPVYGPDQKAPLPVAATVTNSA